MKFWSFALAGMVLIISNSANAALVSRLGGLAYYDTEANLTWLSDANAGGLMSWADANSWVEGLDVVGIAGWQLPDTLQPDSSCGYHNSNESFGYNCAGSKMGNMFHNVLGNVTGSLTNTGPFINIQSDFSYWSATEYTHDTSITWSFNMGYGSQSGVWNANEYFAWAVYSGDVSAVPVPAAVWLFGSGLVGLVGFAKRKKT